MTVFTRSDFIFSESSNFNLSFGINQLKISQKFAEQWLPKAAISRPADERRHDFSNNALI